jgi:SAM-dependent methyltransferase
MKIQDHLVSKKWFSLEKNQEHGFWMTVPKPSEIDLPSYYPQEEYLSHQTAPSNFLERVYHLLRFFAIIYKTSVVKRLKMNGKRLLDMGCGAGFFLKSMQKSGWQISGVEPNKDARLAANRLTENAVFDNEQLLRWENSSFDAITLWHVLEHLSDLGQSLVNLSRLLDDHGKLIVALPNHLSYDAHHYRQYWAAYDVPRHLWHFSKDSLVSLMMTKGFMLLHSKPLWLDAYYISLLSETYRHSKLRWVKAIWHGTLSNVSALFSREFSSRIYIFEKMTA